MMKTRILLIDDDPLTRRGFELPLLKKGYEVIACQNGNEGLEAFLSTEVDLILCDICMPSEDSRHNFDRSIKDNVEGIKTIEKIRKIETQENRVPTPVIMMTGFAKEDAPILALKAGVQDYLQKPIELNPLVECIEKHIKMAARRQVVVRQVEKTPELKMFKTFNIIGTGIVSSFGFSKEDFWNYINNCSVQKQMIKNANYSELNGCYNMRIENISPLDYFNEKQLHNLDNNSIFVAIAAHLAVQDLNINIPKFGSDRVGIAIGTSISIATAMSDYDESVLRRGSRRSAIGIFPNTVMCAPASRISIFEQITGSNTTISTGMNSGLDALIYAFSLLEQNNAELMIAGGSDALSNKILLGYQKENLLFSQPEEIKRNKRGAFIPSEGACVFLINTRDQSQSKSTEVYCEILSYANGFAPVKKNNVESRSDQLVTTLENCFNRTGIDKNSIDGFILGSYFDEFDYKVEVTALEAYFKKCISKKPILTPKKMLGESFGPFSAQAILVAIGIFGGHINHEAIQNLNENESAEFDKQMRRILFVQVDSGGHHSAIVLQAGNSD